ncbi:MAG TPA: hypothetical protein VNW94_20110 [Streptosporangiaceae bacterium]|nr:hypothetical protein [Streptosporangiaceae bacterium]
MHELGRVLRLDARRTMILVAVPVLALLGIAAAWRELIPGVAYWDNTVVAISASVRLLGPVAAALSAWVAVREHRLDYLRSLTPRSPATGPLVDLLLLGGVALPAYGLVALTIIIQTVLRAGTWELPPAGLLAGAAALALHVVLGYLAGRLIPNPLTVVAVAAATRLWDTLRGTRSSWLGLLPPAAIGQVGPFAELRPGLFADQLLWSAGLSSALVLGYVLVVSRQVLLAVPLAAAVALTAAGTVRLHDYGGAAVAPAAAGYVCRDWPLTVCVHPALRDALPDLEAAATPLAARLAGTEGGFTRVFQLPGGDPVAVRAGVAWTHLRDLAPGYERRAAREIRAGLADPDACTRPTPGRAYSALVDAWLTDEPPPAVPDAAAGRRFARWSEQRRRSWLRAHYPGYRQCALAPADFPR